MSLVDGVVAGGDVRVADVTVRRTALADGPVAVGVRPESLALSSEGVPAIARFVEVLGADALVLCELASGEKLVVRQPFGAVRPGPDAPVHVAFGPDPADVHLFDLATGERHAELAAPVP